VGARLIRRSIVELRRFEAFRLDSDEGCKREHDTAITPIRIQPPRRLKTKSAARGHHLAPVSRHGFRHDEGVKRSSSAIMNGLGVEAAAR
jgi:hypothetical protein